MRLILLGPPGSGKGTQAERLKYTYNLVRLSTGDMLRDAIVSGSDIGKKVKVIIEAGKLVYDEIVIDIISERISHHDVEYGFILDGFPRTIAQAEALYAILAKKKITIDIAIEIKVPDELIIDRIAGRFTCVKCMAGYNDKFNYPKIDGKCDVCNGTEFSRRIDDNAETLFSRLNTYHFQTEQIISFYKKSGILKIVDGTMSIEKVTKQLIDIIDMFID
ncbi:MAG: adenylate kinase [Rhodospirillaceae bacterium]|jgi:adenylate kinase|nr:adenylate kinase [Rhodospirillaceae bacterium]